MKSVLLPTALLACQVCLQAAGTSHRPLIPPASGKVVNTQVRLPLAFEPNVGQAPPGVRWISRNPERSFMLTGNEAIMTLQSGEVASTVRMKMVGAKPQSKTEGVDLLPATSNYFLGNRPEDWRTAVPHYARVRYKDVYPGIDVVYYSADRNLEYDFVLSPGADPSVIELAYDGADRMRVEPNGDLVLEVNGRIVRQLRPRIYQEQGGRRVEVAGSYRIRDGNRVDFALARYDRTRQLVIDPVLQYSTYLGYEGRDVAVAVATDQNGDIFMTGQTTSTRFPTTQSAQRDYGRQTDAFIARFSGAGQLMWISYLGGREFDIGRSIAVDAASNAYVAGFTVSDNFPVQNATKAEYGGSTDAFLTKISSNGQQFLFSSYIGGTGYDDAYAVAVDAEQNVYVAGQTWSFDFPVRNGFQTGPAGGGGDTFVTKLATTSARVVYSTYVGGSGIDTATGIAVDAQGAAYVTGYTTSAVFPVMNPIQGALRAGSQDAFLYKLNSSGQSLVYSTFLGGSGEDLGFRVAVDADRAAYVYGYTKSTDFPVRGAFQASLAGALDLFVSKVNPAGDALVYSTYIGGGQDDVAFGNIFVDAAGSAYISGYTSSTNFPVRNPVQPSYGGGKYDAFVTRLAPQGNSLIYSTLIGGSGQDEAYGLIVDRQSQVVIVGGTSSPNLPQANNSYATGTGEFDVFLARLSADASVNFITSTSSALTFAVRPGLETAPQTISLASSNAPVTFTAGSNQPWLRVSPESGSTPATLTLTINSAALTPNAVPATVTINSPAAMNSPLLITVTANQLAAPLITSVAPNPITRAAQDREITLTGTGFQNGLSVRINGNTVSSQFVNATTVRATIPGSVLNSAASLQIVVFNPDGIQSPLFQLPFASAGPEAPAAGIVNSASGIGGQIAPGEIISVYGTNFGPPEVMSAGFVNGLLPTQLASTRLLVDGVAAPILSVGPSLLSAIVPYSVLGRESVAVEVEYNGQRSTPVRLGVGAAAPGLYTQSANGSGPASAYNQDGSLNSVDNPALAGSVVTLFGTGEGLAIPAGPDGRQITGDPPRPVQTVTARVGGMPAVVEYAGGSPGSVNGLLQLNIRLPLNLTSGAAVPVVITIAGVNSRDGVTIAVR